MLYRFFHILVSFSLRIFFRKIEVHGKEFIRPGVPQILASNHPSGFLEPLLMACFFPRSLYFLVRGDVFENRFLKPILVGTHQLPIYRFKDGFSKLRSNESSLMAASDVLGSGKCILIFAEGSTKSIKMVRPLQKGFVRLASDTLLRFPDTPIEIVPIGVNFSDSTKFRGEVMIRIEKPIVVDTSLISASGSKNSADIGTLLNTVYSGVKENVIHLENQSRLTLMEDFISLAKISHERKPYPKILLNDHFLQVCRNIADKIDTMSDEKYQEWKDKINGWKKELGKNNISLDGLSKIKPSFWQYIALIVGFIPALIGFLTHLPPLLVSYLLVRSKVKNKEFYGSLWFVGNIVSLLLFYLIVLFTSLAGAFPLYYLPLIIFCGYIAQFYYDILTCYQWIPSKIIFSARKRGLDFYHQCIQ